MDIKALSEKNEEYIIQRRRYYHRFPELSGEEKNTAAAIKNDLEQIGVEAKMLESCYGVIGTVHGLGGGKSMVALRADIDALPVNEATGLDFTSENEGKMHACGHDAHIAMLLGAAKVLMNIRESLNGDVRLLFQPSEENTLGAKAMIDEGALNGVDALYGAHIWGTVDSPKIDVCPGNKMAGSDCFSIEVEGISAHGSAPELGVDAIVVASAIVMNLQSVVSRMSTPLSPLVVSIGTINGGRRFNIIANKVVMEGSVRYFDEKLCPEDKIRKIVESTAEAFGASADLKYWSMTAPLINKDEKLNRIAHDAVVKLYGEKALTSIGPLMSSEDFAAYGELVPIIFGFIGSRNIEKDITSTNHQETYTVDEDVLKRGSALMAQFAHDFLAES